jgi:F0F1-type ATP synthase membrane subunit b/b'
MKTDLDRKIEKNTDNLKQAASGIAADAKEGAALADYKVSLAARETGRKLEKAGNEMKASLQQMKKDIKQIAKKADRKNQK